MPNRLTHAEEIALANRRDAGDLSAESVLVERNLALANFFAAPTIHRYPHETDDLLSVAYAGLAGAARDYDPAKGFRFATCVRAYIRQSIHNYLRDHSRLVRVPAYLQNTRRFNQAGKDYQKAAIRAMTLKASGSDSVCFELDRFPDRPGRLPERDDLINKVEQAVSRLPERERRVLSYRFGLNSKALSVSQIAAIECLCRKSIWNIEQRALQMLREILIVSDHSTSLKAVS